MMHAEPHLPSDPADPVGPEPVLPSDDARPVGAAGAAAAEPELPSDGAPRAGPRDGPRDGARESARDGARRSTETPPTGGPAQAARDARAERIREATARGPLGRLPEHYEHDDWATIRSDNPFEVLYLDYRQPGAIGRAVLEERRDVLAGFWRDKDARRSQGAGPARERIEREYGPDVGKFARRVERAFNDLADPAQLRTKAQELDDARRRAGEAQIADWVDALLEDGLLTVGKTNRILQRGEAAGLALEEAANYLRATIVERGFIPRATARGATVAETLRSSEWLTRARLEEEMRARIAPIKIGPGTARTLGELVDLCDAHPAEARRYFADEGIERWLGASGEMAAQSAARERRRTDPGDRPKALELFVRDLSIAVGRPAVPVLALAPDGVSLGELPVGATAEARVAYTREGPRLAWGTARLTGQLPGATVSGTFEDYVDGAPGPVTVHVDTLRVPPGTYAGAVVLEPVGGAPVSAPVRYTVAPLTLTADRPKLDLGTLPFGETRRVTVRVTTSPPGGRLVGEVALTSAHSGLGVAGEVQGAGATAELTVHTQHVGVGQGVRTVVRFTTNAGVLDVPVTFRVRGAAASAVRWAGGLAAAGGAAMWFARDAARDGLRDGGRGPAGWHLTLGDMGYVQSFVAALCFILIPVLLLFWVVRAIRASGKRAP